MPTAVETAGVAHGGGRCSVVGARGSQRPPRPMVHRCLQGRHVHQSAWGLPKAEIRPSQAFRKNHDCPEPPQKQHPGRPPDVSSGPCCKAVSDAAGFPRSTKATSSAREEPEQETMSGTAWGSRLCLLSATCVSMFGSRPSQAWMGLWCSGRRASAVVLGSREAAYSSDDPTGLGAGARVRNRRGATPTAPRRGSRRRQECVAVRGCPGRRPTRDEMRVSRHMWSPPGAVGFTAHLPYH